MYDYLQLNHDGIVEIYQEIVSTLDAENTLLKEQLGACSIDYMF